MCGICGFTGAVGSGDDKKVLESMCDAMAHRGPDGEGLYIADGIALGHRRLALVDLAGGGQPMVRSGSQLDSAVWSPAISFEHARGEGAALRSSAPASDELEGPAEAASLRRGRWSIVFNGEIYNYRELRTELQRAGYAFSTGSDTEVLLVGYIAWSEAVLERLRGMFAFAIYDAQTRELFCARDFFGIKPFYYTVQAQAGIDGSRANSGEAAPASTFIFASEIKSLLEHPAYARKLNEEALAQYLCFQFNPLDETFFKGVYKLPQGHCLRVGADGAVSVRRYWRPSFDADGNASKDQVVARVGEAVRESVRYHNVADVEVGSFLSSGIDSSYLAACLACENPQIKTFTVGFAEYDGERDEVSWARELAEKLEIQNDAHYITEEEYWEAIPRVQWHMDEPTADPSAIALYFVDKLASRRVKAVLSGEGADELFGGYRIYQAPLANAHVGKLPKPLLRAGSKALRAAGIRGAHYLERASGRVRDWYYTNANDVAFSPEERECLLSAEVRGRLQAQGAGFGRDCSQAGGIELPQRIVACAYDEAAPYDETAQMQYVDTQFWLVGDILLKTDKMAMAHSLESRVPFLDRGVFEVAARIPTSCKLDESQTKIALREAAELAIPRDWAQKQKLGFPVPIARWLRDERYSVQVRGFFQSDEAKRFFDADMLVQMLDSHCRGEVDNSRRIWIIYSFLVWYHMFFVGPVRPNC